VTFGERVAALEPLGFSHRQTEFLVTVALHSGFSLRRHYMAFAGLKYGAGVRDFLDRLVARRLARRSQYRPDRGHVYHLHATGIYAAIEQHDNRNRRRTSPALIARKLMLLDYVLGELNTDWFATEQDKVALFTTRFGIKPTDLPRRVYVARRAGDADTCRYFIHKMPIRLVGTPPLVSFVSLVTDTTGQAFEQFLQDHVRLLNRLPAWQIVAVAPRHIPGLPACSAAFQRFGVHLRQPRLRGDAATLQTFFTIRDHVDRGDFAPLTIKDLDLFRDSRHRYSGPEFEELYQEWRTTGASALQNRGGDEFLAAIKEGRGQLITHRLPIGYDRFGTRAGVT
jgi:hypothetical protein